MKPVTTRQSLIFGLIMLAAVAAGAAVTPETGSNSCLTRADVIQAVERSWHGISLSCNETLRQDNLRQQ